MLPASRLSASHLAGILGRKLTDCRPVELVAAMGQQCQEPVTQEARQRHGHPEIFRCRERQADVFVAKRSRKTGGFEFSIGDQPAIGLVDGGIEQR